MKKLSSLSMLGLNILAKISKNNKPIKVCKGNNLVKNTTELPFSDEQIITRKKPIEAVDSELIYLTDGKRHLICVPYSKDNLHKMAMELDIKKCWFHKNHYDIPKERIEEIERKCRIINPKEIVEIISSPDYA